MTAARGLASRDNRPISPALLMPISKTAALCTGISEKSMSGRPVSLFKLPSVFNVLYRADSTAWQNSFVVVFPTLPVTASTFTSKRLRYQPDRA